ncbi:hypothetical protein DPMN_152803 [Dreissena polymorpha]|uniref:Uncharacterized protein n=1 Tax=Dreissena polymorpha TaxID=45954 RepID=A0A9D4FIZ1_DREPO|nr:hypothetical protein DPMN_152803 [Dreissena polymorpha]
MLIPNTPVTPDWRPYCVLKATRVAVRTPLPPEERRQDARGRSEDTENCSRREPTATTLNMFKVVAEVRRSVKDAIVVIGTW